MRTNIILAFIFFALLGVAFYTEEVYKKKSIEEAALSRSLLKKFDFKKIHFPHSVLVHNDTIWEDKEINWPLSQKKVDFFLKILNSVEIRGVVKEGNAEQFFRKSRIQFAVEDYKGEKQVFVMGDASETTGRFYLQNKDSNEIYICQDTSHMDVPYSSERDFELKKYMRLKYILEQGRHAFWESNFLEALKIQKLKTVQFDSNRNRSFELNFIQNTTKPTIPSSLSYKDIRNVFESYFKQIRVVEIIDRGQNILTDKMSQIAIESETPYVLKYFAGLNEQIGRYILVEGLEYIFRVEMEQDNVFYLSPHHFWLKKFQYNVDFQSLDKLNFELSFDGNSFFQFQVYDLANFKLRSLTSATFSQVHMNVLFNLILNLVDFSEATYVEPDKTEPPQDRKILYVKMLDARYAIWVDGKSIIVKDQKNGLNFYFSEQTGQITERFFSDIFTVNRN